MTTTYKTLFQSAPAAATLVDAYTVPSSTSTVIATILCCNRGTSSDTIRMSVAVAGAADTAKQYAYFDLPVVAKDTYHATIGITMAATDVLRVYSTSGNTVFSAFGCEVA